MKVCDTMLRDHDSKRKKKITWAFLILVKVGECDIAKNIVSKYFMQFCRWR